MSFALQCAVLPAQAPSRAVTIAVVLVVGCAFSLVLALLLPIASQAAGQQRALPITDPTRLPRLDFKDLRYAGAFRLPAAEVNEDSFSAGGGPIAFNPERRTLYVGSRRGRVAEVSIPAVVNSSDVTAMQFAEFVQPFADPSEGRMSEIGEANLAGLLVFGRRLYSSGLIYYDANNTQTISHFVRPLALATKGAGPIRRVGAKGKSGFVAGYMADVPPEWQTALGGPALTGQCCVPIIHRTSWGPAAFAWNPEDLARGEDVEAIPLVYYDARNQTLGPFDASGRDFGATTAVNGLALIAGTRTAIFVGSNGTGPLCYGNGTGDRSLHGTVGSDGSKFCYDPTASDKGQHAYPYNYQMWAYDLNDWAAVRRGRLDPWEVKPYGVWQFELPVAEPRVRVAGVAYDREGRRLFISQREADRDGFSYRALIHVYHTP
jgi:hypothetical protein